MKDRFGVRATRLFAVAAQTLGWRPGDFWQATPAELNTALLPPPGEAEAAPDRETIQRMMEQDDARHRRR